MDANRHPSQNGIIGFVSLTGSLTTDPKGCVMGNAKAIRAAILKALKEGDQETGVSNGDISKIVGVLPGTLYPHFLRLVGMGLIEARWEGELFPSQGEATNHRRSTDRLRKRFYRLTPQKR